MELLRVGYDIDGVIIGGPELMPESHAVIITGRVYSIAEGTLNELNQRGINNPVSFNPLNFTHEDAAIHKSVVIKEMGLEVFYEDTWKVVQYLRVNCPDTKIIHVG